PGPPPRRAARLRPHRRHARRRRLRRPGAPPLRRRGRRPPQRRGQSHRRARPAGRHRHRPSPGHAPSLPSARRGARPPGRLRPGQLRDRPEGRRRPHPRHRRGGRSQLPRGRPGATSRDRPLHLRPRRHLQRVFSPRPHPMRSLKRAWRWFVTHFPFGLLVRAKPRHFREMLGVAWDNRGQLGYAWRILRHGVCDGCSLGPYGLRDNVIPGTHLCLTRLKLLKLNTMDAMPDPTWADIGALRGKTNEQLHAIGRVPYPLLFKKGDAGFRRITWDEALQKVAAALTAAEPDRMGFFASSRGITNETYYTFQKLARIAGTPHVDSCARLCHAASSSGLKETIGWGAGTCSLKDWIGSDLIVLFGTDLANNQPMTMKYLHYAKKAGTKVVLINPFKEPALERYWVPSVPVSAVFGT